ncbi:hypothetical protein TcBrA4_0066170 [Trypanosoma cruzi]|nr:hypothetical protein TcBrA4_0066170 [Trypanosoma cruzi]
MIFCGTPYRGHWRGPQSRSSCGVLEALRCMAALRCGNWSRVELPGHKPDRCGVNWGSMTSRMRATRIRSMSLLRQLVIVAGRWGSRSDAVFPGLQRRGMTTTRLRFRVTVPARRRLLNSRGTARFAARPRWRQRLSIYSSGPGASPRGSSRRVRSSSAIVIGGRDPLHSSGSVAAGMALGACCFCRPQPHEVADLLVSAEHWNIGFHGWCAQGTRNARTAYYLPAVAVRGLELGAERVPAAFGCFA